MFCRANGMRGCDKNCMEMSGYTTTGIQYNYVATTWSKRSPGHRHAIHKYRYLHTHSNLNFEDKNNEKHSTGWVYVVQQETHPRDIEKACLV